LLWMYTLQLFMRLLLVDYCISFLVWLSILQISDLMLIHSIWVYVIKTPQEDTSLGYFLNNMLLWCFVNSNALNRKLVSLVGKKSTRWFIGSFVFLYLMPWVFSL
jgi:hypothetical protein